jgi:hypothetical protein
MYRLSRLAPLSGLVAAVLFGTGSAIWGFEQPARDAGTAEIVSFYENTSSEILIGGTMSIISLLFFLWFGAVLYERLIAAEGSSRTPLPLMAFGGAVLIAAVGLGAETINMAGAARADDGQLTPGTAQIYFDVSCALGYTSAGVAVAAFAAPIGLVALRTGQVLSRWAALLVLLIALAMLTPAVTFLLGFAVLFLAAFSIRLYRVEWAYERPGVPGPFVK